MVQGRRSRGESEVQKSEAGTEAGLCFSGVLRCTADGIGNAHHTRTLVLDVIPKA